MSHGDVRAEGRGQRTTNAGGNGAPPSEIGHRGVVRSLLQCISAHLCHRRRSVVSAGGGGWCGVMRVRR